MKSHFRTSVFFGLALFAVSGLAQASLWDGLSPADQAKINAGQQVLVTEDVSGSAWPRITVLQRFESTPEQAAGVMFDYPLHKQMFEGITQADIAKQESPTVAHIDYTMVFPKVLGIALPDEHYLVRDVLSVFGDTGYDISWTMIKASSMKDTAGSVKFEKLGTGTLVSYTNFINPPRPGLAKLIVKMAISRVQDAVKALDKEVQAERNGDQAKLNDHVAKLAQALGR